MPPAVASDLAHIQQEQVQAEPAEPPQKGIPALPGLRRPQQRLWRRPSPTLVRRRVPASRLPFLLAGALHVVRRKNGSPSTHPLRGPELRALRPWKRQQDEMAPYVFTSWRGGPPTIRTIHFVVAAAGKAAGIKFPVHPTCSGMRPASIWRTPARTHGQFSSTWGTRIFSTPCATRSYCHRGSRISGRIEYEFRLA